MKFVHSSSPGKCILFGEHAVVYGYPAIAMAISLESYCFIEEIYENQIQLELKNYEETLVFSSLDELYNTIPLQYKQISRCLKIINKRFKIKFNKIKITLTSNLFPSSGLGSSASIATALIAGLNTYYELHLEKEDISKLAYEMEKIVHGSPSGIDNTICTFGNMISFQKGKFHNIEIPYDLPILITYTNVKHDTKKAIEQLRKLKNEEPRFCDFIFDKIRFYTETAESMLLDGNLKELGILMNINQKLLAALNLSNNTINQIVNIALMNGAYGSKLTGAGLGGCVITLGPKEILNHIWQLLEEEGYKSYLEDIDREGVRIEEKKE